MDDSQQLPQIKITESNFPKSNLSLILCCYFLKKKKNKKTFKNLIFITSKVSK